LKVKPRQGYVVVGLDLSDAREIFAVRSLIEPATAALACQFITPGEIARLQELAQIRYAADDDQSQIDFMEANRELHIGIARASRNRRLESIVERLLDDMQRIIHQVLPFQQWGGMVDDHQRIVNAIATRDPAQAHQVMEEAIEASRRRVFGVLGDRAPDRRSAD
jgi:DNA-binding GntR family transcriptional regulator